MDLSQIAKNAGSLIKHNSTTVLTGLGVAGSLGAVIWAIKITPRAVRKLDSAYYIKNNKLSFERPDTALPTISLTKFEAIKTVWKDYLPVVILEGATIACVIGSQSINLRKQAALISAFSISETALREYQERMVIESPTKDRKVRDDISRSKIEDNPVTAKEVLLVGNGDQLFYEAHTDRYFMSTMQKVQKAVNDLNFQVLNQNYASLNEFYSMVGLKAVAQGEELGWTTEHQLEVDYSSQVTDDDRAAIVINYVRTPTANYWKGYQ